MTTLLLTPIHFLRTLALHLWWSISSIAFYENVFNDYKGYGLKYIFTLSFLSSLMCSTLFLDHIENVQNYLSKGIISSEIEAIDHVIGQLPTIDYDGKKISVQEDTPLFLYTSNNKKILVIDPNNKLLPSDRTKIPILFSADTMIINFINSDSKLVNTLPVKYTQIFGYQPQILTQELVKSSFAQLFSKAPSILIFLFFPIMAILIFVNILLDKSFIIITIYLLMRLGAANCSLKTCVRIVLFASGVFALLQFIIILTAQNLLSVLWFVQLWANLLMVLGILKAHGKYKFFYFK